MDEHVNRLKCLDKVKKIRDNKPRGIKIERSIEEFYKLSAGFVILQITNQSLTIRRLVVYR